MRYLNAALELGYPPDCATDGTTYGDLVRTWNPAAGPVPARGALSEKLTETELARRKAEQAAEARKAEAARRAEAVAAKAARPGFWARLFGRKGAA